MKEMMVVAVLAGTMLVGCGKPKLTVSYQNTSERSVAVQSTLVEAGSKGYSKPDGKGGFTHAKSSSHTLFLSSYPVTMQDRYKEPTADDQVKVAISLTGQSGTDIKSPLAAGSYSPKAEWFQAVDSARIYTYGNGKYVTYSFDPRSTEGNVKITSVQGDEVKGEIDLAQGQMAIKGAFTAKLAKN